MPENEDINVEKSTHRVEVVPVKLEPHPNADSLSLVRVFAGYVCCVRTIDWQDGQLAAYVPPDSVVDSNRPEFAFCAGHERIKVKKLRGIVSMGLLIPAPEGSQIGDDVAEQLGVVHYEPPMPVSTGGEAEKPPDGYHPVFDVDSLRRYASVFQEGEPVWITEKLHGASAKYCWSDGRIYCGSRTEWKREDEKNLWWRALRQYPELEVFCRENPEITVYGEVYGAVQDLKYGMSRGEIKFAAFDLLRGSEWINPKEARELSSMFIPWVPLIEYNLPFNLETVLALAEGDSLIPGANHEREGVVVKPIRERTNLEIGRVCLKVVSNRFLERH